MKWKGNNEPICFGEFKIICPFCGAESEIFNELHDFVDYVQDNWVVCYIEQYNGTAFVCNKCSNLQ